VTTDDNENVEAQLPHIDTARQLCMSFFVQITEHRTCCSSKIEDIAIGKL